MNLNDSTDDFLCSLDRLEHPSLQQVLERASTQNSEEPAVSSSSAHVHRQPARRRHEKRDRGGMSQPILPDVPWTCSYCTLTNQPASLQCEACGMPRINGSPADASWICAKCSAVNSFNAAKCGHCRGKRPPRPSPPAAAASEATPAGAAPAAAAGTAQAQAAPPAQSAPPTEEEEEDDGDELEDDETDTTVTSDSEDEGSRTTALARAMSSEEFRSFVFSLGTTETEAIPLASPPPTMQRAQLKPFQQQALYWMMQRESGKDGVCGGILADAMGLGKTRSCVALVESTRRTRGIDQLARSRIRSNATLIVCPLSVMGHWVDEIRGCVDPPPKVLKYHGATRRRSIFEVACEYDYVITTYQTIAHDYQQGDSTSNRLNLIHWLRVVLDEGHYIRNRGSRQSRGCANLMGDRRWILTGTPLQNRLDDLFALLQFLGVPQFSVYSWWQKAIVRNIECGPEFREYEKSMGLLQAVMRGLMLRRNLSSKLHGEPIAVLPPLHYEDVTVTQSTEERDFYDAVHANAVVKLDGIVRKNTVVLSSYATAFELLMRCRQACLHPYLVVAGVQRQRKNPSGSSQSGADLSREMVAFVNRMKQQVKSNTYAKSVLEDVANQKLGQEECVVCLDTISEPAMLPCGHIFCNACVVTALQSAARCPLCKKAANVHSIHLIPQTRPTDTAVFEVNVSEHATWIECTKGKMLLEAIRATPPEERIVVFSHFLSFLQYLVDYLLRAGIRAELFCGTLSGKQRHDLIQRFQTRPDGPRVLLATIQTCGVGLTLTRASRCILMEPAWNPGVEQQAIGRLHRMGQTRTVVAQRLITPESIEERIAALGKSKLGLSEACIDRKAAVRLGRAEILRLFDIEKQ